MQFLLLVYVDPALMAEMPPEQFDAEMKGCLTHAADLQKAGTLLDFQQLEPVNTAKSVRVRGGKVRFTDGPFAETKELLAGFNLIEAGSIEEAMRIAHEDFPWAKYGCIEVRPVRDIADVRRRVGAA